MEQIQEQFVPKKSDILGNDKPFRLLLAAGSGSGKSTLVSNILCDPDWGLIDKFDVDRVYIICPTVSFDDSYDKVIKSLEKRSTEEHEFDKKKQIFEEGLESAVKNVYNHLFDEQRGKKDLGIKKDASLIILDDVLLEIDLSSSHSQVARILTKCRHANISVMLCSQHLMGLAPICRNQLTHMIFFNQANAKELKKIREETSSGMKAGQFDALFNFCIAEPFSFMLVCANYPLKYRYFKGNGTDISQLQI